MKKRILSFGMILLFLVSAVKAEIVYSRSFAGGVESNSLSQNSIISDKAFICLSVPEHRTLRVSEHMNRLISHHRRTFSFRYFSDVSFDLNRYINPDNIRQIKERIEFPGREHHPGEEIIRYIHDQDGEKENPTFL